MRREPQDYALERAVAMVLACCVIAILMPDVF